MVFSLHAQGLDLDSWSTEMGTTVTKEALSGGGGKEWRIWVGFVWVKLRALSYCQASGRLFTVLGQNSIAVWPPRVAFTLAV